MSRGAVIFDLDGTLTRPVLDFDAIRAEIGVTGTILEAMESLAPAEQARAEAIIVRHEWEAARTATLHDGAAEVIVECRRRGYPVAILTRNARATTDHVLAAHGLVVDAVRTREDGVIKPAPDGVHALCDQLQADPRTSWMVGDYLFDVLAGKRAGTRTVLMIGESPVPDYASEADYVVRHLRDFLPLIDSFTASAQPSS